MSVEVMREIWRHARADGTALLLLLAIGDHADSDGYAWPSVGSLARKVRLSERQTQRLIGRLVELGELVVLEGRGRGHLSQYVVSCRGPGGAERVSGATPLVGRKGDRDDTVTERRKVTETTGKGDAGDTIGGTETVTPATEKGDTPDRAYREGEPSKKHQREEGAGTGVDASSRISVPEGLTAFDAELRACPGYAPDERFYAKVLEKYRRLDLEEQAIRIRGWFEDPRNRRRVCSRGFVLGWLRREIEGRGTGRRGEIATGGKGSGRKRDLGGLAGLEGFD